MLLFVCFQVQTILKRKQEILEGYENDMSNERKGLCCRSLQEDLNLLMWDCAIIIIIGTIKVNLLLMSNKTLQLCLFFNIFIKQSMQKQCNYDMIIHTSWKTNLSNQTTSLLRPLWLGTNGGLNSEVLLYLKTTIIYVSLSVCSCFLQHLT